VLGVHTPLMQVVHTPLTHVFVTELVPEVPVDVVHLPFTQTVVTHDPLLHTVLCVVDWLIKALAE
jgi:hypothetical protein